MWTQFTFVSLGNFTIVDTSEVKILTCTHSGECNYRTFDGVRYIYKTTCRVTLIKTDRIQITSKTDCDPLDTCRCTQVLVHVCVCVCVISTHTPPILNFMVRIRVRFKIKIMLRVWIRFRVRVRVKYRVRVKDRVRVGMQISTVKGYGLKYFRKQQ